MHSTVFNLLSINIADLNFGFLSMNKSYPRVEYLNLLHSFWLFTTILVRAMILGLELQTTAINSSFKKNNKLSMFEYRTPYSWLSLWTWLNLFQTSSPCSVTSGPVDPRHSRLEPAAWIVSRSCPLWLQRFAHLPLFWFWVLPFASWKPPFPSLLYHGLWKPLLAGSVIYLFNLAAFFMIAALAFFDLTTNFRSLGFAHLPTLMWPSLTGSQSSLWRWKYNLSHVLLFGSKCYFWHNWS